MMNVLFVEDDERVQRFVRRGLQSEGYSVTIAANGEEGYKLARELRFDILILDVMLPGIDGRQLCNRLRKVDKITPILMLTAVDHTAAKVDTLREGADDYLTKPFDFDELLARMEALTRRALGPVNEPPSVVEMANFRLDREAMMATVNNQTIAFTAKEFQLIDLFVSTPGKVLSRSRILNKVWGYDSDPLTNVVDVYVRRLRTKIGWDPDTGCIKTLRSYGYRFDPPG